MGQTISNAIGGTSNDSNKRARDEEDSESVAHATFNNAPKRARIDDTDDAHDSYDKEDGEISEPEDAKPRSVLRQRLDNLKRQARLEQEEREKREKQREQLQKQHTQVAHPPLSHAHAIRYPYTTPLPTVPFTNYDVELVKNGLLNGLTYDFLLKQGVEVSLLNYASSLIQSTPSTSAAESIATAAATTTAQVPSHQGVPSTSPSQYTARRPPKRGVNLDIYNQNKELFQRDPKSLTKAEKKERKRIARLTKTKVKEESGGKRKAKRTDVAHFPVSSADDFLNSLALSPHYQESATSATSASLVEPPSQTFNAAQKPGKLRVYHQTPFLKSKPSEIIITPSDDDEEEDEDENDEEVDVVDSTKDSHTSSSARPIEQIPDWVVGRAVPVVSNVITHTPTPPPTLSLTQRAAQGDVKAQNELKRKENEIHEMQLKIKQMEIRREKQKLEALMMGRMKSGSQQVQTQTQGSSSDATGKESSNGMANSTASTSKDVVANNTNTATTSTTTTTTPKDTTSTKSTTITTKLEYAAEGSEEVDEQAKQTVKTTENTQTDDTPSSTTLLGTATNDGGNVLFREHVVMTS
ncbi:hypothetical protein E3P99_03166 [Wallemia hederae]|uniref:Uncharacterized protein n=1 Tax=Wallemia hederae TaxID=1540922 RepID=A0A4T0FGZ8_9BASI|nr:hypothetical protein E3P99_03166 [Wallemia hederae]